MVDDMTLATVVLGLDGFVLCDVQLVDGRAVRTVGCSPRCMTAGPRWYVTWR